MERGFVNKGIAFICIFKETIHKRDYIRFGKEGTGFDLIELVLPKMWDRGPAQDNVQARQLTRLGLSIRSTHKASLSSEKVRPTHQHL